MKAVFVLGNHQVEVRDVAEPEPKDDLVVVKIMASALCGTEHTAYEGPPRYAPITGGSGHEAAGIVWKTDKARCVKEGDRVTIYPTVYENCHACPACWSGEWQRCSSPRMKRSPMGTHTQYMLVPEYLCLPIPDNIPFTTAAMIDDCIGTPYRAIKRLGVNGGDTVFITGAGPIGAAAATIVKFLNGRVIIVDLNDYRLEQAKRNGADHVLNPQKDDVLARVKELTGNRGADVAIDCSGVDVAQVQCLDAVKSGGRAAFLGIRSEKTPVNVLRHFILKELTVIGSWASTPQEHIEIVGMLNRGVDMDRLITHSFGIEDASAAFETFFGGRSGKVLINTWLVK